MSKNQLHLILFLLFAYTLISCNQKTDNIAKSKPGSFFDPINLGRFNKADNFTIYTSFTECGEWGGHEEELKIYSDSESIFLCSSYSLHV